LLRVLQRVTHYKHGDRLEFKLNFSVRDLLTDKRRAVRDQMEALVQAVQKAGSYQAREEAARAVHAVMAGMKDWVPADALSKLAESAPVREAARLGRSVSQRLQKCETSPEGVGGAGSGIVETAAPVGECVSDAKSSNETPEA